jgi:hypothetical protein
MVCFCVLGVSLVDDRAMQVAAQLLGQRRPNSHW